MADFSLGLAKTAVEGTLSRVQSAIDEETKLKAAAQQDLVFITGEFQMMQSFLKVASKERAGNEVVKTWVRQLRDLAFDVEDCVEFVIHLHNDSAMTWLWRLLPSCMAPPRSRDLDVAVAELKLLKARVEEVSQRNTRYNLISDSGSNTVTSAEQLVNTGPSTIDILMELWQANGKHRGVCNLQKLITSEGNDLQVIYLWGSAGSYIEGAQIINKAYCDPEISRVFKVRAWVKLMHPFNHDEFLKNLQTQLQASSWSRQAVDIKGGTSENDPMRQLTEQRYLIILEGVPSVVEWDIIRMYLPDNNNGSRIVVSTKQLGDAIFLTGEHYRVSVLREFTGGQYLCAFYKKGSVRRNIMGDLIRLTKRPVVMSVWGTGDDKSTLVRELFDCISKRAFGGWVDVAHPFIFRDFYQSLLQVLHKSITEIPEDDTESIEDKEHVAETADDDTKPIEDTEHVTEIDEGHPEYITNIEHLLFQELSDNNCLVVINGLQSTEEWQLIKGRLAPFCDAMHIIVITNEESVATGCVDYENRVFNVNNVALHPTMQIHDYLDELFWRLRHRRVISVCGADGETSTLLKQVYDGIKYQHVGFKEVEKFEYYVWVGVPHPFDEDQFHMRLFKEWFPDVEDEDVEESFHRAREKKCIFIINGLQSTAEWELIKPFFVEWVPESRVILIANEENVAKHFVEHLEANVANNLPLTKASDYYGYRDNMHASRSMFLSNRMEEPGFMRSAFEKTCDSSYYFSQNIRYSLRHSGRVTSVWGIAGVGKSCLVRNCYYQSQQLDDEHSVVDRFAWVDVPDPFDLVEFSRLLLLDFHRCDLEAMEAAAIGIMLGQDPIQGCREILRQDHCYLVIIDGLQSTCDWDLIETAFLSQPIKKHHIVVITTDESIAKHSVQKQVDQMVNIKCLEDHEAYDLFKQIIDPNELASLEGKVDLAKLVAKCGGLPKVVCAIGKVSGSFLEHMNDDFMVKLETDPQFHSLSGLLSWMHFYFDACSDLVKPCIFYLSVFPASSKIRRGRLLRRWIAEGYSRDTPGCTARVNAQNRLSELVKLSIIQQATSKDKCKVNGFFLEYIISRPMEDNLVFALDGHCNPNTQRTGQHLTIMADWHKDQNVFESIDLARLRSLTVFGQWCSFFISDKMRRLRVLDLEDMIALTNYDIEQIFEKLLSLKFISLRGCRKISRLPHTLGGLRQLQTLDVRFTSIVVLPSAIIKLHKLQYIRAGSIPLPDEDWTSASSEDVDLVTSQLPAATSPELEGRNSISAGRQKLSTSPEIGIAESPAHAATSPELEGRRSSISAGRQTVPTSPEIGIAKSPAHAATSPELVDHGSSISAGRQTVPTSPEICIAESPAQSAISPELVDHASIIPSGKPTVPTFPGNGIAESPAHAIISSEAQCRPILPKLGWASKLSRTSVVPRLPKFPPVVTWSLCGSERDIEAQHHNGGVEVPLGIEKLVALHTVGVVNVNASGGEAFLKQLSKLTQLLKLRVCGINKKNWQLLCSALSDHGHLESLSVRFDEDCLDDSFNPPKTLKSLKLYGPIRKLADTIKVLVNLKKVDLEMTITRTEDIRVFLKELPCMGIVNRLCIKVQGDHKLNFSTGELNYSYWSYALRPRLIKMDCSSKLDVTFGYCGILQDVEVLIIQCSNKGSSFWVSGSEGLIRMYRLKTVWLKGSYSEELRQHLKELVDECNRNDFSKPVLKLEPL